MMVASRIENSLALSELLKGIVAIPVEADCTLSGIANDSRKVKSGDLFMAVNGQTGGAERYIDSAIAAGCCAIVWEPAAGVDFLPLTWRGSTQRGQVPLIACAGLSSMVGVIADRFYAEPSRQLKVIGITGTNGKTSCSQFIAQAISTRNPCIVIGTLGYGVYGKLAPATHTTPDAVSCQHILAEGLAEGAHAAVMEVSSHALDQQRVAGIHYHTAVFTNLTRDHLDYHGSMEQYGRAKRSLFQIPELRHAIINADDSYGQHLIAEFRDQLTVTSYGTKSTVDTPDIYVTDIQLHHSGIRARVHTQQGDGWLEATVLGRFNMSNLLAALGTLLSLDWSLADALSALSKVSTVPGRMENFTVTGQALVVVDYAHTPDALEQVLLAAREHTSGDVWCVFGCGGDRDRGKRPLMGELAQSLSDHVVVTNDNPRHEEPQEIIAEILTGMSRSHHVVIEPDRRMAIRYAINNAKSDDVVVVAGKGHEEYQQFGDLRLPFSDVAEVRSALQERR